MSPKECWNLLSNDRDFLPVAADFFEEQGNSIHLTLRWMLHHKKFPHAEITGGWDPGYQQCWTWYINDQAYPEECDLTPWFNEMKSPHHQAIHFRDFLIFEDSIRALHKVLYDQGELVEAA